MLQCKIWFKRWLRVHYIYISEQFNCNPIFKLVIQTANVAIKIPKIWSRRWLAHFHCPQERRGRQEQQQSAPVNAAPDPWKWTSGRAQTNFPNSKYSYLTFLLLQETGRFLLHLPAGGVWRFPLQGSLPSKISPTQRPLTPPGVKNQVKFQPGFHEKHFSRSSICNRREILPGVRPYVGLVVLHQSIPTSTSYTLIRSCSFWVSNIKNMFCPEMPEIIRGHP